MFHCQISESSKVPPKSELLSFLNQPSQVGLRKRLVLPRWLILAVLGSAKSTPAYLRRDSKSGSLEIMMQVTSLLTSNLGAYLRLWSLICSKFLNLQCGDVYSLEVDVTHLLKGTREEVLKMIDDLSQLIMGSFRISAPSAREHKNNLSSGMIGMQLVKSCQIADEPVPTFKLVFNYPLAKIVSGEVFYDSLDSSMHFRASTDAGRLLTLNPDVVMQLKKNAQKKLLIYLGLELKKSTPKLPDMQLKSNSETNGYWMTEEMTLDNALECIKETKTLAASLYDNGVLSWDHEIQTLPLDSRGTGWAISWNQSMQLALAQKMESMFEQAKFPSAQIISISNANKQSEFKKEALDFAERIPKKLSPNKSELSSQARDAEKSSGTEEIFLYYLKKFENSLNSEQLSVFLREKNHKSKEEFRAYFEPVLKRLMKLDY
jgi:hypothetical protein